MLLFLNEYITVMNQYHNGVARVSCVTETTDSGTFFFLNKTLKILIKFYYRIKQLLLSNILQFKEN